MHYGNKKQLKAQKVLITIYKDKYIDANGFGDGNGSCTRVDSIVEAKHVSTHSMCQLHYNIEQILQKEIPELKEDIFYLVELKTNGWAWKVIKVTEITDKMMKQKPLLGLH